MMENYDKLFDIWFEGTNQNLNTENPEVTIPRDDTWCDAKLDDAFDTTFVEYVYDRASYKPIMARFINLYFNGTVDKKDHVESVILDMIGIAYVKTEPLFTNNPERYNPPYAPNESEGLFPAYSRTAQIPNFMNIVIPLAKAEAYKMILDDYTTKRVEQFYDSIKKIYDACGNDITEEEKKLRSLLGYLALTLVRGVVKTEDHLYKAFIKKKYYADIIILTLWWGSFGYAPPCKECINHVINSMTRGSPASSAVFKWITKMFVDVAKLSKRPPFLEYIRTSLLTETARYGLGMLELLDIILTDYDMSWKELRKKTLRESTMKAWERIAFFYNKYLKINEREFGYCWARIINDRYLRGYTPKENLWLAFVFAALIEPNQEKKIYGAEQMKNVETQEDAWKLGVGLREEITAECVAKGFYTNWTARFGIPKTVMTNHGTQFENALLRSLSQLIGDKGISTTSHQPGCKCVANATDDVENRDGQRVDRGRFLYKSPDVRSESLTNPDIE